MGDMLLDKVLRLAPTAFNRRPLSASRSFGKISEIRLNHASRSGPRVDNGAE